MLSVLSEKPLLKMETQLITTTTAQPTSPVKNTTSSSSIPQCISLMAIVVNYRAFPRSRVNANWCCLALKSRASQHSSGPLHLDRESPRCPSRAESISVLSIQAEYIGGVWPTQDTEAMSGGPFKRQTRPVSLARTFLEQVLMRVRWTFARPGSP